jgi:hypothetical protein
VDRTGVLGHYSLNVRVATEIDCTAVTDLRDPNGHHVDHAGHVLSQRVRHTLNGVAYGPLAGVKQQDRALTGHWRIRQQ